MAPKTRSVKAAKKRPKPGPSTKRGMQKRVTGIKKSHWAHKRHYAMTKPELEAYMKTLSSNKKAAAAKTPAKKAASKPDWDQQARDNKAKTGKSTLASLSRVQNNAKHRATQKPTMAWRAKFTGNRA